jgi:hypothetical protein
MQYLIPLLIGTSSALITIVLYLLFTRQAKPKQLKHKPRGKKYYRDTLELLLEEKQRTGLSDQTLITKYQTTVATLKKHATVDQLNKWNQLRLNQLEEND